MSKGLEQRFNESNLAEDFQPGTLIVVNLHPEEGFLNANGENAHGQAFTNKPIIVRVTKRDLDAQTLTLQNFDIKDRTPLPNITYQDLVRGCVLRIALDEDKLEFYRKTPKNKTATNDALYQNGP